MYPQNLAINELSMLCRELYLYFHPEDEDVTEAECKMVTSERILSVGQYNDLGIQVWDKLILLIEAQPSQSISLCVCCCISPRPTRSTPRNMKSRYTPPKP